MPHFNGPFYDPAVDDPRLTTQHERIKRVMLDGAWRTLKEIAKLTGDPEASISAQLRHFRKERFGSWTMETRARGDRERGLYECRLLPPGQCTEDSPEPVKNRPRLTQHDWRELADELPRVVATAESHGHVASDALKKLIAYVSWRAR